VCLGFENNLYSVMMLGSLIRRLWALYQAKYVRRNVHIYKDNLDSANREMVVEWLCNSMLINKDKQYPLLCAITMV
jgi:thymidylate synthase